MRVFSASIESFLDRLTVLAKRILREDFRVSVGRTRFRTADGWSWPLLLVAIDDKTRLGSFDPDDCTIGIHKRLMYSAKDRVLVELLRHEIAHYFTFIAHQESGLDGQPHGPQFQQTCERFGLPPDVRRATCDVEATNDAIEGELATEAVIGRIQRLLSLAESENEHEAELALVRANELMVRHNLDAATARGTESGEIEYCVKLVLPYKRTGPRATAIAKILSEFLVFPVHGSEGLEVTGTRANVEHAEYIAGYLDRGLRAAWKRARTSSPRKLREKPFMEAAAESYLAKLRRTKAKLPATEQSALVVLDEEIQWAGRGIYGGALHRTTSRYRGCAESSAQGARAGAALEIRRGLSGRGVTKLLG